MNKEDHMLEMFLEKMPLSPLPAGFIRKTMQQAVIQKYFRLRFIDFALPVFLVLFLPIAFSCIWWGYNQLDPFWLAHLRLELNYQWLILPRPVVTMALVLLPASALLVLALLGASLLVLFSNQPSQKKNISTQ